MDKKSALKVKFELGVFVGISPTWSIFVHFVYKRGDLSTKGETRLQRRRLVYRGEDSSTDG